MKRNLILLLTICCLASIGEVPRKPKFKIGQVVICVSNIDINPVNYFNKTAYDKKIDGGPGPDIITGHKYIINAIYTCTCGQFFYDVGVATDRGVLCYCHRIIKTGVSWCDESNFLAEKSIPIKHYTF